ncbi:MAG: type I-E CRISPR-associated protein Cas6/Cse3/CasE [Sporichthyaceae bacterium]|nr:type I-E CRISPR-associated protein Cas6/Cse3/CasE [Sporichthyaceae bacterium]
MPYLSRVWLHPLRPAAQRMLRNPHVLHAAVLGGLSRQPVAERVLWRPEAGTPYRASVLVLTESLPSWEHLVEQAGWPSAAEPQALVRPYEPLLDRVVRGREFAFRLRANPVSATRHPAKPSAAQQRHLASTPRPRGVRVAHRTAAHQMAWFTERITRWGFEIPSTASGFPGMRLAARERVVFSKSGDDGDRRRVVLQTATFEGRLRVADPDLARASLLCGVGPARAYGCGLITLATVAQAAAGG